MVCILNDDEYFVFHINSHLGSCQSQIDPCSSNGICLQLTINQFRCQCRTDFTGIFCQIPLITSTSNNINQCLCNNGGTCLSNGTCLCPNRFRGRFCQLSMFND